VLAAGLDSIPGLSCSVERTQTDMVIFTVTDGRDMKQFVDTLTTNGVLVGGFGGTSLRAVTHYGIGSDDIEQTLEVVRAAMK
jgi:threonine aldolase